MKAMLRTSFAPRAWLSWFLFAGITAPTMLQAQDPGALSIAPFAGWYSAHTELSSDDLGWGIDRYALEPAPVVGFSLEYWPHNRWGVGVRGARVGTTVEGTRIHDAGPVRIHMLELTGLLAPIVDWRSATTVLDASLGIRSYDVRAMISSADIVLPYAEPFRQIQPVASAGIRLEFTVWQTRLGLEAREYLGPFQRHDGELSRWQRDTQLNIRLGFRTSLGGT